MTIILAPFLLITILFTVTAVSHSSSNVANATNFIRMSCNTTLYPQLCYHSLASYANSIQQDPASLAQLAVRVSFSRTKRLANYIAKLSHQANDGTDPRATSAIHDCFSVFGDAVDQIRGSLNQMHRLTGSGEELRFQMSNVQTWMSAALTNDDTCMDGFQDVADGPMKIDVCNRTVRVMEVTSNALALVNSFVDKVVLP